MSRRLLDEFLAALVAMTALTVFVAAAYWAITGLSPWPEPLLAEIAAFGSGLGLLTLTSPRSRN
jgi:hypothetical protein